MTAPSPALQRLVEAVAARIRDPEGSGHPRERQAVWRAADRVLVACADNAAPGADWCGWHADRSNGRILYWHDRDEAVRVEHPRR